MMIGAILFALITPQSHNALETSVEVSQSASPAAPEWATPPNDGDVQLALRRDTETYSTNGPYNRYDYAVRNLVCGSLAGVPETAKANSETKDGNGVSLSPLTDPDRPAYKVRCSFEYAERPKKNQKLALAYQPRIFSERELKRIPAKSWKPDAREMVYFGRNICRFMGRNPAPGECHYWAAKTLPDNISGQVAPNIGDIQMALHAKWIRDSSSGMYLFDYAVRDLTCSQPLSLSETADAAILKHYANPGIIPRRITPLYKLHCTFEHTRVERISKEERSFPAEPRVYTKTELEKIGNWQKNDMDIFYMSDMANPDKIEWLIPSFYMLEK